MKRFFIILVILVVLVVGLLFILRVQTKSHSPEQHVHYENGDLKIQVFYNSPQKKDREIFGTLVPFDEVWRLGANEPTTIETNQDLHFGDEKLPKGTYSMWAIPGQESWTLIINAETPDWGLDPFTGKANVDRSNDVLVLTAPVLLQEKVFEAFTIDIEAVQDETELVFMWDKTLVAFTFNN